MKSIFLDCNDQLAPVWARVIRAGRSENRRQPRGVRARGTAARDRAATTSPSTTIPTCRPTLVAQCPELKHIVFLGTGPASYMNVDELDSARHHRAHHQGLRRHRGGRAHDRVDGRRRARHRAHGPRGAQPASGRRTKACSCYGKTLGVIGLGGIGREVARIGKGIGMDVIGWNRTRRAGVPTGRSRHAAGARRRGVDEPHAQRRNARFSRHAERIARMKPGVDPGQHRARRAGGRSRADRRAAQAATSATPGSTCSTPSR